MTNDQMLRALVSQRLTAAGEEVIGLFEGKIVELEQELSRSKEEYTRQQKLLDVLNPEVRKRRADVRQPLVVKEEVPPEQQEWSSSLKREDPERPHVEEELCTGQE